MNDKKPKVSIGLPVYNGEDFLAEALDSLLDQTYDDFELIISDNASTDSTAGICTSYSAKDSRIRYLRSDVNLGAAVNYNLVFELATGEYFKWAAHDDICAPEFIGACVDILDRYPDVVLCYSKSKLIDEEGQFMGVYADDLHLVSPDPKERLQIFFEREGLCHPAFGLVRSDVLARTPLIGNYPRSDRNLIGELALHGKIYEIPDELFVRRLHPETSTEANVTEYDLATWFDPSKRGSLIFPRWRRTFEYVRAIHNAPLSPKEEIQCHLEIARFLLKPRKVLGIGEDIVVALRKFSTAR